MKSYTLQDALYILLYIFFRSVLILSVFLKIFLSLIFIKRVETRKFLRKKVSSFVSFCMVLIENYTSFFLKLNS